MALHPLDSSSRSLIEVGQIVYCMHKVCILWQFSSYLAIFVELCINTGFPAIHVGG